MKRFYNFFANGVLIFSLIFMYAQASFATDLETGTLSHYTTVWDGENGQNHMNFIVISAILEDLPLAVDDEIAIFSGNSCVGAKKLTQVINIANNSTFLTIPASQNDGSNNGFVENDTIIIKIWDNKNQKEMVAKAVTYRKDMPVWLATGKYSPGATSVVEIVSYVELTQTIELKKGYNMISTCVTAKDQNISAVTKLLSDQGNLLKVQDEAGNAYENWGSFGGWINNIGSIQKTEGYKIKVANNCSLQVTGRPIVLPLDIPLKSGWNIISFPHTDLIDAKTVVQSLIDQNKLVKVQDEAGNSIEDWGVFGGWKNGIGNFQSGKAYKIKMNADAILTINKSYLKSAVIVAEAEETEYFNSVAEGNGYDHMNINIVDLKKFGLAVGDELAAFDGEICVGSLKITEKHLSDGNASLISSFSTDDKKQNGFTPGNAIKMYLWNKITGNESIVQAETINGKMNFEKNSSIMVQLKSASTIAKSNLTDLVKIEVYPNPSMGKVTVRFSEMPDTNSRVDILDMSGRKVVSRPITNISEVFELNNQPAGLYLVKSILGTNEVIQKLVIN